MDFVVHRGEAALMFLGQLWLKATVSASRHVELDIHRRFHGDLGEHPAESVQILLGFDAFRCLTGKGF
jgi:hypothetical protein